MTGNGWKWFGLKSSSGKGWDYQGKGTRHGTRPKAEGFGPEDWSLYRMKKCVSNNTKC